MKKARMRGKLNTDFHALEIYSTFELRLEGWTQIAKFIRL